MNLKIHTRAMVFAMISILAFGASCNNFSDLGTVIPAEPGTIKARVDGRKVVTSEAETSASIGDGVLTIIGHTSGERSRSIGIVIMGVSGEGVYPIMSGTDFNRVVYIEVSDDKNNGNTFKEISWIAPFDGSNQIGAVTIISIDAESVSGTFEFRAKSAVDGSTIRVTDGSFDIEF